MRLVEARRLASRLGRTRRYQFARDVLRQALAHDIAGLSAELAYRALLAVFPFLIFVGALSGYVALIFHMHSPAARIINHAGSALPADVAQVFKRQLSGVVEGRQPALLSFGLIGSLLAASAAAGTVIKAINRVYGVRETRGFWRRTALAVVLTLLAGAALIAASALLIVGQVFGHEIANQAGLGRSYELIAQLARWPVVFVLVLAATTLVYRFASARRLKLPWASAGALFFSFSWLAMTYLFGLYIDGSRSYRRRTVRWLEP